MVPANGGDWGSTSIDRRVLEMLQNIFGDRRYKAMTDDNYGFINLRREIEIAKCSFDMETDVVLTLPTPLISSSDNEVSAEDAVNVYRKANGNVDLFLRNPNYLMIPATYFRDALMGPTILSTYKHVAGVLDQNSDIRQVLFPKIPSDPLCPQTFSLY